MRKMIIFMFAIFFAWGTHAEVMQTSANLKFHISKSLDSYVLKVLPRGTNVNVQWRSGNWSYVYYNGMYGYVYSSYLSNIVSHLSSHQREVVLNRGCGTNYYTNVDGYRVQCPTYYRTVPSDATAKCRDGSYSFSLNRRGTCSRHGGVAKWY